MSTEIISAMNKSEKQEVNGINLSSADGGRNISFRWPRGQGPILQEEGGVKTVLVGDKPLDFKFIEAVRGFRFNDTTPDK